MSKAKKINDREQPAIRKSKFAYHLEVAAIREGYQGSNKLKGKVALITGGDSGIGRSVALYFAREGADVAIVYDQNDQDAQETRALVTQEGRACKVYKGDLAREAFCKKVITSVVKDLGKLDILVNNAGIHEEDTDIAGIDRQQLMRTFEVNIFSFFYCTRAALEVMPEGSVIINTASVVAYRGSDHLLDYSASKGAVVAFTRSLSANLAAKKIRVNGVAPGPVWTPLVVAAFEDKDLAKFGKKTPLGRAGYPQEIAPAYVYLASDDSSFVSGQIIHVNGGDIVNA